MTPWSKRKQRELEETKEKEAEKRRLNQQIYCHAEELLEEMNLRMFLLQEDKKEILFVDSICVATISYSEEKARIGFLKQLFGSISQVVRKIIQNIKKERRA